MIDERRKKRIKKGNKQSIKEMQIAVEKVVFEADTLERKEKAEKMADMGKKDEWRRMICVETVNALENNVVIYPGKSHTIGTEIAVQEY